MSNEPKHTATPWTDDKFTPIPAGDDRVLLGAFRQKPKVAVRVLSEENYQHAAKCVNEYDALIEKIELLKDSHREYLLTRSLLRDAEKDRSELYKELESLRAENAELIEALMAVKDSAMMPDSVLDLVETTLAKYEKPMTEPNLFDNTELTVLGELERVVKGMIGVNDPPLYKHALRRVLIEIELRKPTEIEKLKLAFAEGGAIPQSAESWVRKFKQG